VVAAAGVAGGVWTTIGAAATVVDVPAVRAAIKSVATVLLAAGAWVVGGPSGVLVPLTVGA